jgi:uncharacterized membrane protein
MREWLTLVAEHLVLVIHAMAMLAVAFGTVQAFATSARTMFDPSPRADRFHHAYVRYARWLVAALTFQLAADIVETAFTPGWEEIGRLAAIAAIRTFLNYFLERDLEAVEKRTLAEARHERAAESADA